MNVFPANNLFLHRIFQQTNREDFGIDDDTQIRNFSGVILKKLLQKVHT
jgi:hypothetical protein